MPEAGSAPTRLWGGRFEAGPAEALARLSVSVQFDWRLAPYDLLASRAHARVLAGAGLLDRRTNWARCWPRWTTSGAPARPASSGRPSTTRTCTPRWSAACWSGSAPSAASCGPAGPATTRSPPTCGSTCATTPAGWPPGWSSWPTRWSSRPSGTSTPPRPGMTHLQHAQPVLFGHQLLAHVQPLLRDLERLRDWDERAAVSPLGAGALAGSSLPLDPAVARELGFTAAAPTRWTRSSTATSSPSSCFVAALSACTCPGSARRSCSGRRRSSAGSSSTTRYATGSSIMPQKKNADVAELARGKAGRLIGGLDRPAHHAQGPAADLQPGHAGGQGAGLRRGRHAGARAAGAGRHDRHDPAARGPAGRAAPRGLHAGHRGGRAGWSGGACRSARRTRSPATSSSGARCTTSTLRRGRRRRPDADLAAPDPGRPRRCCRSTGRWPRGPARRHGPAAGRRAAGRAARAVDEHAAWAAELGQPGHRATGGRPRPALAWPRACAHRVLVTSSGRDRFAGGGPDGAPAAGLPRSFFDRQVLEVAPALLGCVLEHRAPDGLVAVCAHRGRGVRGRRWTPRRTPTAGGRGATRSCSARPVTRTSTSPTACTSASTSSACREGTARGGAAAGRRASHRGCSARGRGADRARSHRADTGPGPRACQALPGAGHRPGAAMALTCATRRHRCGCGVEPVSPRVIRSGPAGCGRRPMCRGGSGSRASLRSRRTVRTCPRWRFSDRRPIPSRVAAAAP